MCQKIVEIKHVANPFVYLKRITFCKKITNPEKKGSIYYYYSVNSIESTFAWVDLYLAKTVSN